MPRDMKATQHPCLGSISSCYFHSYCTAAQQLADIKSMLSQHSKKKKSGREGYDKDFLSWGCHLLLRWGGGQPIHVWMWIQLICRCKIATHMEAELKRMLWLPICQSLPAAGRRGELSTSSCLKGWFDRLELDRHWQGSSARVSELFLIRASPHLLSAFYMSRGEEQRGRGRGKRSHCVKYGTVISLLARQWLHSKHTHTLAALFSMLLSFHNYKYKKKYFPPPCVCGVGWGEGRREQSR